MTDRDAVREFLRERGCPEDVVAGGLEGLVAEWERTVRQVEVGYALGLDDYLNDLDGRQLADEAMTHANEGARETARQRLLDADRRMKAATRTVGECLWGRTVGDAEGWTAEKNWWYFSLPRSPGPALAADLEGGE